MKFQLLHIVIMALMPVLSFSQEFSEAGDTIFNRVDHQGQKQGYWKKLYSNGNIRYSGQFLNDQPIGTFKRYYEDQSLQSVMIYRKGQDVAMTTFYYQDGQVAAEGKYIGTEKDSIWDYYSYYGGHLAYQEKYDKGLKNGLSTKFFNDGTTSEQMMWKNGKKHGSWKLWYPSGILKMETTFYEDKIHGPFTTYTLSGIKEIEGQYQNNLKEGSWKFFAPETGQAQEILFIDGLPENQEEIDREFTQIMDHYEQQQGRIAEPDINNFMIEKKK